MIHVNDLTSDEIAGYIGDIGRSYGGTDENIPRDIKIKLMQLIILNGILHQLERANNADREETDTPSASDTSGINLHTNFTDFWNNN